jgi:cold shock CspA family protein
VIVPAPGDERVHGRVADYDEHAGLGTVASTAGVSYPFHCTQIAGGSRTIPVGQAVSFVVIPGRGGRWEAGDLRPDSST